MASGISEGKAAAQSFRLVLDHAAIQRLLTGPDGPVAKDLFKRAIMVERRAKQLAPVRTGRLRASIASRLGKASRGLYAQIGTNVVYAPYQEFGTSRIPAHPFLRPALDAMRRA